MSTKISTDDLVVGAQRLKFSPANGEFRRLNKFQSTIFAGGSFKKLMFSVMKLILSPAKQKKC